MLSGLSLANLPTAANLSNQAAQQIQPTAADNSGQSATNSQSSASTDEIGSNSSNATNNSNQAEINLASNAEQAKTADFKQVMQNTATDKANHDSSKASGEVQANIDTTHNTDDDLDTEELATAVADVMASISTALANISELSVELDLDLSDLPIEQLPAYETAINLVDQEVQNMMTDTIEAISSIDMTELSALTEKSEMLDDLQSIHEELVEASDELRFMQEQATVEADTNLAVTVELDTKDQGIDIKGFEATEEIEFKAVNADIKPEQEKEQVEVDTTQIQLQQEINLDALSRNNQQDAQGQIETVKEVEIVIERHSAEISNDKSQEINVQDSSATVEVQHKETNKESFLDKIKFIAVKEDFSAVKTQVDNKANLDSQVKKALIQAADEIKSLITERAQSKTAEIKVDEITVDIEIEAVDITDNAQGNFFGKLVTDTFKQLNIAKPEAPSFTPKQVLNLVQDKVMTAPVNTQEVLRFQLHPKDLGNITITINREAKGVTIQMVVDNDAAISSLKQDISSLSSALKDKGIELKDIDISKASSEGTSSQQQQRGDFNEAREEQKKRVNEGQPFWLSEEANKSSFETQLKGMLNLWRSKV